MTYRYVNAAETIAANDSGWSGLASVLPPETVIAPYVAPPPPVPATVTRFQGRQALRDAGLFNKVVALLDKPETDPKAKLRWEELSFFERNSSFIADLAPLLDPPLSEADIDALFIAAAQID